jgi:poly(A) polymerase
MKYKLYEVGGKVRDYFLGIESKDVDYSVVLEEPEAFTSPLNAFYVFRDELLLEGFEIFLESPDSFTIRARFPESHKYTGVADFVISRKETGYIKGTRQPIVELGTLHDDLIRRDFTVNAMATDDSGNLIDPFGGQVDLKNRILRTPTDATVSINNDPLRILRAMRFSITKSMGISDDITQAIHLFDADKMKVVSEERIREELHKMFMADTQRSLHLLRWLQFLNGHLYDHIIGGNIRLEPTMKH